MLIVLLTCSLLPESVSHLKPSQGRAGAHPSSARKKKPKNIIMQYYNQYNKCNNETQDNTVVQYYNRVII